MADEILGEPNTEPTIDQVFENEDDLLDYTKNLVEQMRNSNENVDPVLDDEKKVDADNDALAPSDNIEPELDAVQGDAVEPTASIFTPITLKDRGREVVVTNLDELIKYGEKGVNYSEKTAELARMRPVAEYAEKHRISMDDLQMLADIKNGKAEAIAELAKGNGIDLYGIDTEAKYQVSDEAKYREVSEVDMVAYELSQNQELYGKVQEALTYVPRGFAEQVVSDAKLLTAFQRDVAAGTAARVTPEALKRVDLYGGDFVHHYLQVDAEQRQRMALEAAPVKQAPSAQNADPVSKAKASVSSNTSGSEQSDMEDIWEDGLSEAELLARVRRQANIKRG